MNIMKEFPQKVREKVVEAANHVLSRVCFVPWTKGQMSQFWRRRSLNQIEGSGEVNYTVPCIDTSALAVNYLRDNGKRASMVLYTDNGAAERFLRGEKAKLHLDAAALFMFRKEVYGFDIGSSDVTLFKRNGSYDKEGQEVLLTTRFEDGEREWHRTPVSLIFGGDVARFPGEPLVELLLRRNRLSLPFGLKREDFYRTVEPPPDGDAFLNNAETFNKEDLERYNLEWLEASKDIFPGMNPFVYR